MKVLPMMQPWASLVVRGVKLTETRDKHTNIRGPVLIYATRTVVPYADARAAWDALGGGIDDVRRGVIIGGVHVEHSARAIDLGWDGSDDVRVGGWLLNKPYVRVHTDQRELGGFGPGRRVWLLSHAVEFDQGVVVRGMPGWFDAPPDVEREAMLQWNGARHA